MSAAWSDVVGTRHPGDGCSGRESGAVGNGERGYEVGEQGLVADEFDSAGGEGRVKTKCACL